MNEITEIRTDPKEMTAEQLGGEIRLLTAQARRMALSYGIQIGYRLKLAHEKVGPHGWAEWLARETEFSPAAASRFQKLYEGYGKDQGSLFGVENNFPTLEKISVSNALRLLAVPEEEREEVAAELDAEHISARELEKALAERDEARKAKKEAEELAGRISDERTELLGALNQAETEKAKLTQRVKELESRPVDVAVERDEKAIQEAADAARKAAEDAAKAEADKLRAKLEKAQAAQKKAEEALEKAKAESGSEAAAEKEAAQKARAEAEELRRKLAAAQSGAGEAAIYCKAAQENMLAAVEKLRTMHGAHPETAEKLLGGMETIMKGLGDRLEQLKKEWTA